jgi:hypothetical protein
MEDKPTHELDMAVEGALRDLHRQLPAGWIGRERELVSLFSFAHLSRFFATENAMLKHQAQIGIEVTVKQTKHLPNMKNTVCKDLVIWREPGSTVWNQDGDLSASPLGVIEWKCKTRFNSGRFYEEEVLKYDSDWLAEFTRRNPDSTGYLVLADLTSAPSRMRCDRFKLGRAEANWLALT